jgi:transposase-like protein
MMRWAAENPSAARQILKRDREVTTNRRSAQHVGGPEEGKRGRGAEAKTIVAAAAEKSGRAIGRIRLRRIKDVSADSLLPFVQSVVAPGSAVHTDGWRGYSGLANAGYQHQITVISDGLDPAHEVMPRVHTVASLLKRWPLGTHQGGSQQHHLSAAEMTRSGRGEQPGNLG